MLSDNHYGIDPSEAEATMNAESPHLLGANECVELAFRSPSGRERTYWTNERVIVAEGKGLSGQTTTKNTGMKQKLLSIPYRSMKAIAVQTAGKSILDRDTELKIWFSGGRGADGYKTIDFSRDQVDLVMMQRYFNDKLFAAAGSGGSGSTEREREREPEPLFTPSMAAMAASETDDNPSSDSAGFVENFLDLIGNDAKEVDPGVVTARFGAEGSKFAILMPGEDVQLAYQVANRDLVLLTSHRLLVIDVKGLGPSSRIEFLSLRWSCVRAFAVETAGGWDFDGQFVIYTSISSLRKIKQDLRKTPDLERMTTTIQMAFADRLLGGGNPARKPPTTSVGDLGRSSVADREAVVPYDYKTLYGGSNQKPIDPAVIDRLYRTNPRLLQDDERVDMAFRGRRDLVVFTTKRIIDVDVKGWSGKKVKYTSIPYSSILGFGVKSAGKHMDLDSEIMVYTEIRWESLGEEPDPGLSYLEWDFNKNVVDVLLLKQYLAERLLATDSTPRTVRSYPYRPPSSSSGSGTNDPSSSSALNEMIQEWTGDHKAVDVETWSNALHSGSYPILLADEPVELAFRAGRDVTCFTDRRILIVDTKGWSGKKIQYTSIPYPSIKMFAAESAGRWDRDSTLSIYTKNHWTLGKVKIDFRKTKTDILSIEKFVSTKVLQRSHPPSEAKASAPVIPGKEISAPPGVNGFTDWIIDFSVEEDPEVANAQLHSNPPILLPDENVEMVYREGRDLWVYTNKRLLTIDVKGLSGTKVKYKSIPWKDAVSAFAVQTEGIIDFDCECYVYTNTPSSGCQTQRLLVDKKKPEKNNIFELHHYLGTKVLL